MIQKQFGILLVLMLSTAPLDAKGPKQPDTDTKQSGYSGKGVPSTKSKYSKDYSFRAQPSTQSAHGGSSRLASPSLPKPNQPTGADRSKYSKQRPDYSRYPGSNPSTPSTATKPVQFPTRQPYSNPSVAPRTTSNHRPSASTPSFPTNPRPATVFYPKTSTKSSYSRPQNSPNVSTAKPTVPSQLPSRPNVVNDRSSARKNYYPGLRPPTYQRPNNTIINRPATVINQNNTTVNNTHVNNITNNTTNVNNWFQHNTWRDSVTVNSRHWNDNPWWYQPDYGDWHHGHWHGHNSSSNRNAWAPSDHDERALYNGLLAWGLGNLVYRSGYQVYSNPYYLQPIVIGSTNINYSQPICVQQSQYEVLFQNDVEKAEQLRRQALSYFTSARLSLRAGNVARALDDTNRAISLMPDDSSLHEFRSLVLFAAGRYREAAEVIHAVLAVAPGWDWTTMSGLLPDHETYLKLLRNLENDVRLNPRVPASRFLLAYHYITLGYSENAEAQLQTVLLLNPDDRLTADLLSLLRNENNKSNQFDALTSNQYPDDQFLGRWIARRPDGEIELTLGGNGDFEWDYNLVGNNNAFRGRYETTGNLLILATPEGSQMVGTIANFRRDRFEFRLLGASNNDPGLRFVRR